MVDLKRVLAAKPVDRDPEPFVPLDTPWGAELDAGAAWPEHPHPQWRRPGAVLLNGWWECSFVPALEAGVAADPADMGARHLEQAQLPEAFDGRIAVPFSPEAPLSGVGRALQPGELLWYRRALPDVQVPAGARCLLHFDAVDWACACWVRGRLAGSHEGGDLPFCLDVTEMLQSGEGPAELLLCVADPTEAAAHLRGKQKTRRGNIWYTAQSGIWQSVWLEVVPERRLLGARIEADAAGDLTVRVQTSGRAGVVEVQVLSPDGGAVVARARADVQAVGRAVPAPVLDAARPAGEAVVRVRVPDVRPWSPDDPALYGLRLAFGADAVESYCAFRSVRVAPDDAGVPRVLLNGRPYPVRAVLDQGRWPDGLLTPPADAALVFDIETARGLGFNTLRKHLKVELDRWYWHCDRLGVLVWQDMPSGGGPYDEHVTSHVPTLFRATWHRYRDDRAGHRAHLGSADARYRAEWTRTCRDAVRYLGNHPSVALWTLFNEGWGQFDARAALAMVRQLDGTRPVDATSGWYDQGCGDFFSVHNYFRPLDVWRDPAARPGRAFAISEFGGLTFAADGHCASPHAYGYDDFPDRREWAAAVRAQLERVRGLEARGLAAYVYTQLTDVEEEVNGLVTYDRRVVKARAASDDGA